MSTTIRTVERRPTQTEAQPPPLLLLLHGFGSNERDLMSFAPYLDPRFHIVAARGPLDLGFGHAWYQLSGGPGNLRPDPATRDRAVELLTKFVRDLPTRLGTDPQRTYLLGFSQGAILSLALGLTMPDEIAGLVLISGYLDQSMIPTLAPARLTGLRVLQIHGVDDQVIPIAAARQAHSFLKDTPVQLTYREYPIGHSIHPAGLELISSWLAEQIEN